MNDWDIPGPFRIIENLAGMAYSEPEAEDAWKRILALFSEHLAQAPSLRRRYNALHAKRLELGEPDHGR